MHDPSPADQELIEENALLKQRIKQLEDSDAGRTGDEEALRESEARMRAFLDNSSVIAWLKDEDGRIVFLSDNYRTRFLAPGDNWKGKTDFELWPREVAEEFRRNDLLVVEGGQSIEVTESAVDGAGRNSWWLNAKFCYQDGSGRRYVGGLGVDITERKRAEEALRESEAALRRAQEITHIGHFKFNPATGVVEGSDELFRLFGLTRDDFQFSDFVASVRPDQRDFVVSAIQGALARGTGYNIEHYLQLRDGTLRFVNAIGEVATMPPAGQPVLVGTVQDITERKRAELELRKSNDRSQAVQRIGRVGYLDWDLLTNALEVSREALEIYHLDTSPTLDQIMGFVHPDDKERVEEGLNATVSGTGTFDLDHRAICRDGTEIHVRATAELFRSDDGTPVRLLGTIHDISERRRAEEALRESVRRYRDLFDQANEGLPIVIEIVDAAEKIRACLPIVDELVTDGLVTLEAGRVITYVASPAPHATDTRLATTRGAAPPPE